MEEPKSYEEAVESEEWKEAIMSRIGLPQEIADQRRRQRGVNKWAHAHPAGCSRVPTLVPSQSKRIGDINTIY